jgi:predicted transcriptional regulator
MDSGPARSSDTRPLTERILAALLHAGADGFSHVILHRILRVSSAKLGESLTQLESSGRIVARGSSWFIVNTPDL